MEGGLLQSTGYGQVGPLRLPGSLLPPDQPTPANLFLDNGFPRERLGPHQRPWRSCLIGQSLWGHRKQRENP